MLKIEQQLAKMIDHSILHPTHTDADLERECAIAAKYNVASVCVKPYAVSKAVELLKGTDVKVGCVIGFPHGNSSSAVKVFETEQACNAGALEIDMVINIGKALGGDWDYVELMRKYAGPQVQVKCAGGVRTLDDLLNMKAAGATRSGATATVAILEEAFVRFGNDC
ncbi:MAG TPA: hypothetical protein PLW67_06350 [Prolixibacteraceae bacterium]|nr:hypothetical protein [Prolixibacteraceae bacterium]